MKFLIKIRENDLYNSVILTKQEKYLGVSGSNLSEYRKFSFPIIFKGLDLGGDEYIANIQISPINKEDADYYAPLKKEVFKDTVEYTWEVTRAATKTAGELNVNLSIKSIDLSKDIVYYSYIFKFIILENINAIKSIEEIPRNILEQYVVQAGAHALNAHIEYEKTTGVFVALNKEIKMCLEKIKNIEKILGLEDLVGNNAEIDNP